MPLTRQQPTEISITIMRWISIQDKEPPVEEQILIAFIEGGVGTAVYTQDLLDRKDVDILDDISHWMPMPEPPKSL